jgi:hypothetical protein
MEMSRFFLENILWEPYPSTGLALRVSLLGTVVVTCSGRCKWRLQSGVLRGQRLRRVPPFPALNGTRLGSPSATVVTLGIRKQTKYSFLSLVPPFVYVLLSFLLSFPAFFSSFYSSLFSVVTCLFSGL